MIVTLTLRNGCRSLDIIVRPLVCSKNFIRLSRFPFQNVRLDRRVKRARLEQSGVKAQLIIDVIAEEFVRGNEHRLSQFGHFMNMYASV